MDTSSTPASLIMESTSEVSPSDCSSISDIPSIPISTSVSSVFVPASSAISSFSVISLSAIPAASVFSSLTDMDVLPYLSLNFSAVIVSTSILKSSNCFFAASSLLSDKWNTNFLNQSWFVYPPL